MGWEAIEQYLTEVEREATNSPDQQVPQMILEESSMMLTPATENHMSDIFSEDLPFNGPRPTYVQSTSENLTHREDEVSYCDLDQDSQSLYHGEDSYKYAQKNSSHEFLSIDSCEIQRQVKCEQFDDYLPYQYPEYFSQDEQEQEALTIASKVLFECAEEVHATCKCLHITPDPMYWSCQNVQDWIQWQCKQFGLQVPNLEVFWVPGSELCRLTEQDFRIYAPEVTGQTLFSRLDVWRNVVEQTTPRNWNDCVPKLTQIPVPTSRACPCPRRERARVPVRGLTKTCPNLRKCLLLAHNKTRTASLMNLSTTTDRLFSCGNF